MAGRKTANGLPVLKQLVIGFAQSVAEDVVFNLYVAVRGFEH
jgi:hypothetical protein